MKFGAKPTEGELKKGMRTGNGNITFHVKRL